MATIVSNQFKNLLDKHLNQVAEKEFEDLVKSEAMIPKLFDVMSGTSAWWEYMDISDAADIPKFSGELEYLQVYPGYTTRIEPAEFAAGIRFERKFIDDNQWNVLRDRVGILSQSYFRTKEKDAVKIFTNAFSSAFDYMTSEEGLSLCNNAHLSKSGATTTSGFDNLGTTALNETSLEAARIAANKFRNDIGERIYTDFDTLIVPDALARTAYEIVGTDKGLYSAEGTVNVQKGRWNVIVYKLLDDTDSNNWYIADSRAMKRFLKWIDRVPMQTSSEFKEFDTFALKYSIYGRWGWGFTNWRWLMGFQVT